MKILLDECPPAPFRHSFPNHEVHTVDWAGLKSKSNGDLLLAAAAAGYAIMLTIDQGILHQQNHSTLRIPIIALRAKTNQLEDLIPLVPIVMNAIESIAPGQVVVVG